MTNIKNGDTVMCINATNWNPGAKRYLNYLLVPKKEYIVREVCFDVHTHKEFLLLVGYVNKKHDISKLEAGYAAERFIKLYKPTEEENITMKIVEKIGGGNEYY